MWQLKGKGKILSLVAGNAAGKSGKMRSIFENAPDPSPITYNGSLSVLSSRYVRIPSTGRSE